jgi:hypothetical protein
MPKVGTFSVSSCNTSFTRASFLEAAEKFPTPGKTMASACLSCVLEIPIEDVKPTLFRAHLRL